jgi:hypothetical protein
MKKTIAVIVALFISQLTAVDGWATKRPLEDIGESAPNGQKTRVSGDQVTLTPLEAVATSDGNNRFIEDPLCKSLSTTTLFLQSLTRLQLECDQLSLNLQRLHLNLLEAHGVEEDQTNQSASEKMSAADLISLTLEGRACKNNSFIVEMLRKNLSTMFFLQSLTLVELDCDQSILNIIFDLPQLKQLSLTLLETGFIKNNPKEQDSVKMKAVYATASEKYITQWGIIKDNTPDVFQDFPEKTQYVSEKKPLEKPLESLSITCAHNPHTFMVEMLSKNLPTMPFLQSLTLMAIDCDQSILKIIFNLPQLTQLSLNLRETYWSKEDQTNIFNNLRRQSTLTTLKLDDCGINSDDVFDMLKENTTLTELEIEGGDHEECSLTNANFSAIKDVLKTNTLLKILSLKGHYFTSETVLPELEQALLDNNTLQEVSLSGFFIDSPDNTDLIVEFLKRASQRKCKVLM